MGIEIVDLHSVRTDLLTKGPVLDTGCRGFRFAEWFAKRGHPVVMMDPAPDVEPPKSLYDTATWHQFIKAALVGPAYPKSMRLRMTRDAEARHITHAAQEGDPVIDCVTIQDVMGNSVLGQNIAQWDVVKLNIEGAELDVLADWPGPIARQIVVSFHLHCPQGGSEADVARVMEHMARWYTPVQHVKDARYGAGINYWDTVLVLKELA